MPAPSPSEAALQTGRARTWSDASTESSLSDASTVATHGSSPLELDLLLLHACVHCRASKTACTDCRPCVRCTRLGLDCAYMNKPRKRACVSCHSNKVACDLHLSGGGVCARCKRLNHCCVPREQVRQRVMRKRRRKVDESAHPTDALLRAARHGAEWGEEEAAALRLEAANGEAAPCGDAAELLLGLAWSGAAPGTAAASGRGSHFEDLNIKDEPHDEESGAVSRPSA
ncbi:hypothetical protein AB1Y20_005824 [Prymnesium parvum]|uniref:Zn(2)-C6 fungal-type domain-containing protein n=1 Tax=Prymnesium parvum TaxID=97485 RepID=A0AB34J0V5_PRYPA